MRFWGTALGSLERLAGLVVLPARKGVLSGWILREDAFSKSVTISYMSQRPFRSGDNYWRSGIRGRRLVGQYDLDLPVSMSVTCRIQQDGGDNEHTSVSTSTTTSYPRLAILSLR